MCWVDAKTDLDMWNVATSLRMGNDVCLCSEKTSAWGEMYCLPWFRQMAGSLCGLLNYSAFVYFYVTVVSYDAITIESIHPNPTLINFRILLFHSTYVSPV